MRRSDEALPKTITKLTKYKPKDYEIYRFGSCLNYTKQANYNKQGNVVRPATTSIGFESVAMKLSPYILIFTIDDRYCATKK